MQNFSVGLLAVLLAASSASLHAHDAGHIGLGVGLGVLLVGPPLLAYAVALGVPLAPLVVLPAAVR